MTSGRPPGDLGIAGVSRRLLLALALTAPLGCGAEAPDPDSPRPAPEAAPSPSPPPAAASERLSPTWGSAEEAAQAFLDALAAGDPDRLRATALTREEFADVVWPELPSSRPNRNLPLDYAWRDLNQKSTNELSRTHHRYGGRRFALERVEFLGETTGYVTFDVHREARLLLTDEEGTLLRLRLFGSMIERGGRWKLFSFVIDD